MDGAAAIHVEPGQVVIDLGGGRHLTLPHHAATLLGRQLMVKAKESEALLPAVVAGQVADQALLLRRGLPLGLSNDPRVKAEALKEAAFGTEPRKMIPSSDGIGRALENGAGLRGSAAVVGAPAVLSRPAAEV